MIDNITTIKLIDKLMSLSVNGKITWATLPYYFESNENEPLRKMVVANNQYAYSPIEAKNMFLINEYRSYCANINGGSVIIITTEKQKESKLTLSIQTHATHGIFSLYPDNDDIREKLRELILQITAKTDDIAKYVNELLKL